MGDERDGEDTTADLPAGEGDDDGEGRVPDDSVTGQSGGGPETLPGPPG